MKKLAPSEYPALLPMISPSACGAVYPRSVLEGIQRGTVYTDGSGGLIRHDCGFAFLCGEISQDLLDTVYTAFLHQQSHFSQRFLLFSDSPDITAFFSQRENLLLEKRLFFSYSGSAAFREPLSGARTAEIDSALLARICGRITPSFSWESPERFLQNGKGFCVTVNGEPAAWAFSAAVSQDELDIGVETAEAFRRNGYAFAAAAEMIQYALAQHKKPVWACHAENTASRRLAESLGFVQTAVCCTIRRP